MIESCETLICLLMLFGVFGGWIILPMLILFIFLHNVIKGDWFNPCSWIDLLSFFTMVIIWYFGLQDDYNHRGMGRFFDAMVLGAIYAVVIVLRLPLVWIRSSWKNKCALISFVIIVVVSVVLTCCFDIARE